MPNRCPFQVGRLCGAGASIDFGLLSERAGVIYGLVEEDEEHLFWSYSDSGDWAFVRADGNVTVANPAEFDQGFDLLLKVPDCTVEEAWTGLESCDTHREEVLFLQR